MADPHERLLVVDGNARSRTWAIDERSKQAIRDGAPDGWRIHFVAAPTSSDGDGPPEPEPEVVDAIRDADVYFGFGMPKPLFLAARRLRWVHSAAAGVGSALYPEMVSSGVLLTNSAGVHAIPIAEYIVAGVLHFLRGLDLALDNQRRHDWNKEPFVGDASPLREVCDCRVLVVGTGGIGTEVARRFSALGARCVGIRRRPELGAPPGFARVSGIDALDAELASNDVIVLTAPHTAQTRGLLTAERIAILGRQTIVVNVGRGALIDEDALGAALRSKRIRGAVLDVFSSEPLPAESPFWDLPSVIVTPHVSPVSPGRFWPRQLELFLDNWHRYTRGEPLRNLVDKKAGY